MPRQARGKHREKLRKEMRFLTGHAANGGEKSSVFLLFLLNPNKTNKMFCQDRLRMKQNGRKAHTKMGVSFCRNAHSASRRPRSCRSGTTARSHSASRTSPPTLICSANQGPRYASAQTDSFGSSLESSAIDDVAKTGLGRKGARQAQDMNHALGDTI
eukprot:COSAG06_NODE_12037_length_1431_cov_62.699700_2_plen_158_part_00